MGKLSEAVLNLFLMLRLHLENSNTKGPCWGILFGGRTSWRFLLLRSFYLLLLHQLVPPCPGPSAVARQLSGSGLAELSVVSATGWAAAHFFMLAPMFGVSYRLWNWSFWNGTQATKSANRPGVWNKKMDSGLGFFWLFGFFFPGREGGSCGTLMDIRSRLGEKYFTKPISSWTLCILVTISSL